MILLPIGCMYICGVYQTAKQNIVPFFANIINGSIDDPRNMKPIAPKNEKKEKNSNPKTLR